MRRKFAQLSAMLMTGLVVVGATLLTSAGTAAAGGCGHWSESGFWTGTEHYYTHCTNDGSTARVLVFHEYSFEDVICVGPNQTASLGQDVKAARYEGLCRN
jgi:hypothetical protein